VIPIVVCTVGSSSLPVLEASVKAYCPEVELIVGHGEFGSFGADYNAVVSKAFEKYDEIIVANDDIVLNPSSYQKLLDDVAHLKRFNKLGWVVSKADAVRPSQDIRYQPMDSVYEVQTVSPLFGYISKEAWVDFPPINWYSDDVQCLDMSAKGYRHFVSKSYIHHVGSTTIGQDNHKNHLAAEPWIRQNRPELHAIWFNQEKKVA
jgi:hypothetical protein